MLFTSWSVLVLGLLLEGSEEKRIVDEGKGEQLVIMVHVSEENGLQPKGVRKRCIIACWCQRASKVR
jgi:hypothetical protein